MLLRVVFSTRDVNRVIYRRAIMNYPVPGTRSGLMLLFFLILSGPLFADELKFIPRASLGVVSYDFTQSARPNALAPTGINNNEFPEVNFAVTFKMLGVGGTFLKNGYYFDVSYQKSLEEEDSFTLEDPALPGGVFTETFKGDREDYSVTFGKKLLENRLGLYAGYKAGTSQATGDQGQVLSFEEDGLFIGVNYGWQIGDKGVLSVNLAYADLEGDLKEDVNNPAFASPEVLAVPLDTDASSDAQGLSYGLSWSSRLTQKLSYSVALDAKKYTFDKVEDVNPNTIPSDEFEEEFIGVTFSVFYLF
jgi:hypothetical protein